MCNYGGAENRPRGGGVQKREGRVGSFGQAGGVGGAGQGGDGGGRRGGGRGGPKSVAETLYGGLKPSRCRWCGHREHRTVQCPYLNDREPEGSLQPHSEINKHIQLLEKQAAERSGLGLPPPERRERLTHEVQFRQRGGEIIFGWALVDNAEREHEPEIKSDPDQPEIKTEPDQSEIKTKPDQPEIKQEPRVNQEDDD